jgi:hypothetical protein
LIIRLEFYTNEVVHGAPSPRAEDQSENQADSRRVRVGWDVTLALCAVAYLAFVLFDDVESPLLSIALIVLVAYALIQPHVRNR